MADLWSNRPFCSNDLMISSQLKKSRWSVYEAYHSRMWLPKIFTFTRFLSTVALSSHKERIGFRPFDEGCCSLLIFYVKKEWYMDFFSSHFDNFSCFWEHIWLGFFCYKEGFLYYSVWNAKKCNLPL